MDLFSEVYGCYFTAVAKILKQAQYGMTKTEIEDMVNAQAFCDSAFHLLPRLLGRAVPEGNNQPELFLSEWNLLEKKSDGNYYAKPQLSKTKRPMTSLEKAWIKALLSDKRIRLFISQSELNALESALTDIAPLFSPDVFHVSDSASDGDPYDDKNYIQNFKSILKACILKTPVIIHYESGKQKRLTKHVFPYKISYSSRDDKFRLLGILIQKGQRYRGVTLNLARINSVEASDISLPKRFNPEQYLKQANHSDPIVLQISKERNALERCMLQFASWEKQTEYDEEKDLYICKIFYDKQDETELLIRILSFGPVVKVIGPEGFLKQVKERVHKQFEMLYQPSQAGMPDA